LSQSQGRIPLGCVIKFSLNRYYEETTSNTCSKQLEMLSKEFKLAMPAISTTLESPTISQFSFFAKCGCSSRISQVCLLIQGWTYESHST